LLPPDCWLPPELLPPEPLPLELLPPEPAEVVVAAAPPLELQAAVSSAALAKAKSRLKFWLWVTSWPREQQAYRVKGREISGLSGSACPNLCHEADSRGWERSCGLRLAGLRERVR
jgi:hypothetical protein